jgi:UDP-N-acetylglucosamine 2-epimerase (non-hydrolysing)
MKVASIIGARPQFIKYAPVASELRKEHTDVLIHTGQHYDPEMSDIFFSDLNIPQPDYNLNVGSTSHGRQTGKMLSKIEDVLVSECPDLVMVFGDTNSTLAGALAAVKLHIPVAHVEAGLRSFDRQMPEEINRILTDQISTLLFCPTLTAVQNLKNEGITKGVFFTGDVMVDALERHIIIAEEKSNILRTCQIQSKKYYLMTIHRPQNTDHKDQLETILAVINDIKIPVVFPIHPRTKKMLIQFGLWSQLPNNLKVVNPVGYLDMLMLLKNAKKIITDSGGIQKEAYILGVPSITLRDTTEWIETLEGEWNVLTGLDQLKLRFQINKPEFLLSPRKNFLGSGNASNRICKIIKSYKFALPYIREKKE